MTVLHAAFCEGSFLVWAESWEQPAPTLRRSGKTRPRTWFDAGANRLVEIVSALGADLRKEKRAAREAVAWLPATDAEPVASSGVLRDGSVPDSCRLAPWTITALPLSARNAITLLAASSDRRLLAPGVVAGADLAFWTAALRFAAGLVMRGQFLPAVKVEGGGAEAWWKPVIAGEDAGRLPALAAAMPPSARALAWERGESPPAAPAEAVLLGFVAAAADELVRSSALGGYQPADSIHDRWMRALTSPERAIAGSAAELKALAAQVEQWRRPIQVSATAPFRLCFRLEEPPETAETWAVRYLLQGSRDPSLIVPVADAWRAGQGLAVLGKDPAAIREHVLASLGQAAAVCPRIEASLKQPRPEGYGLDAGGAHQFLRETAVALEQSGFGVMLPSWWVRSGTQARLTARAHVKSPALKTAAGLSLESIVQFDWELALGDEKISRAELEALARLKAPLVRVRGQWVEVNAADIQAALEFIQKKKSASAPVREIIQMALGGPAPGPLEVDGVTATGWLEELLAKIEGRAAFEELPQPAGMNGTLRPYQHRGYSWLRFLAQWGLGACLADDMGLGKTVQALALLQRQRLENGRGPVLLVCPTSVVGNWQKEAARFTPDLPVMVHHGVGRHRGARFAEEAARHAIVLSTYALLHRDVEILKEVPWAGVILDEAQNIKNPETKQARAARSLPGSYRLALTGTPVENHVGDLWSLMEFLNPGFLGPQTAFRKRFFLPIQVYSDRQAAERLKRITGPFILRRLKTDKSVIADLPDKQEMKVFCTLTREQASLYEAVAKDAQRAIESAEGIERKGLVLATLLKLKQVCNHPAQFLKDNSAIPERSGKLARLTEMLEETLEVGDRCLVFTQFTEMGGLIRRHLLETFGTEVLYLHGGTPKKQRDRMVERFEQPDGPRVFLLSLKAGGTGLNLTPANHVFHFDRWWNPAVEDQATDRAFRIGQTKNVQVHKFLCAGTLEEKIDEMIERKKDVAGRIVGTGEAWLTELSNADLKNLFALRKDAVGE